MAMTAIDATSLSIGISFLLQPTPVAGQRLDINREKPRRQVLSERLASPSRTIQNAAVDHESRIAATRGG
jgi:hypothetical protein